MVNPRTELFAFVMEKLENELTEKRIRMYRALAEFAGSEKDTAALKKIADDLEAADKQCNEFAFQLTQPPKPAENGEAKGDGR